MSWGRGLRWQWKKRRALQRLVSVPLGPGDIAVDCGAHVGDITARLAESGATVYAFEPNPYAYEVLYERFRGLDRVHCICRGFLDRQGSARLYLHELTDSDPVARATSSSVLPEKTNVSREKYVEIEVVDAAGFIHSLGSRVRLLKIDVEGAECRILRRLITGGALELVDHLFVEMHGGKVPGFEHEQAEVVELLRASRAGHVDLGWA